MFVKVLNAKRFNHVSMRHCMFLLKQLQTRGKSEPIVMVLG